MLNQTHRKIAKSISKSASAAQLSKEIGTTASQTVAERSKLIGAAWLQPQLWANPEFLHMVTEKVEAFSKSGFLVGHIAHQSTTKIAEWMSDQSRLTADTLAKANHSAVYFPVWFEWSVKSTQINIRLMSDLTFAAAKAAEDGLKPIHRKTTSNAHRLSGQL